MSHLIEVAFTGNRKEFFLWDASEPPPQKSAIIVEADRGEDLGRVHAVGDLAEKRSLGCAHGCGTSQPSRRALRLASSAEVKQGESLRKLNEDARRHAMERVRAQGLMMKISDAEWQWDRRKLTLYFTAEHRVDFRQLVRELAAHFKTRIELKQIGVRDEAKRLDGVGRCGRQYCSASWLPELRPVNLGVAKDQRLSLNPAQISGACGRLMCCLRYEHETYVAARKRFPKEGRIVTTQRGEEKVLAVDIFKERVTLRGAEGEPRTLTLGEFNSELRGVPSGESALLQEVGSGEPALPPEVRSGEPDLEDEPTPGRDADSPLPNSGSGADARLPTPGSEADARLPAPGSRKRRRGRRGGRGGRRKDAES